MTVNLDKTAAQARPSTPELAMPDGTARALGGLRRGRPHRARTAAGIVAAALPAVLGLSACGGGNSGSAVASEGVTSTTQTPSGSSAELVGPASPAGARIRAVHAASRRDGLPRPQQQRELPSQRETNLVEQPPPVPGGPDRLQRPAPERWQRADPGPVATDPEHHGGVCPVHAPPRGAELARPDLRSPWPSCFQYKRRPEFARVH